MRKSTASKGDAANDSSQKSSGGASRQRWAAGLEALSKAQAEGAKVFEALVKQGQGIQQRTKEAGAVARDVATAKAREMQQIAGGTIDRLEQVFEERVARALSRMGFYTKKDLERLTDRIDALSEAVNSLLQASRRSAAAAASKSRPARTAKTAKPARTAKRAKASPRANTGNPASTPAKPGKTVKKRAA